LIKENRPQEAAWLDLRVVRNTRYRLAEDSHYGKISVRKLVRITFAVVVCHKKAAVIYDSDVLKSIMLAGSTLNSMYYISVALARDLPNHYPQLRIVPGELGIQ
jgi:hypothetical protein